MEGGHFKASDIIQPKLNTHKLNNLFPAMHLFSFAFLLILLLKIIDFENKLYSFLCYCNKIDM